MTLSTLGPADGTLRVHTSREGVAKKVGHDLVLEVGTWSAEVETDEAGAVTALRLDADSGTLSVIEGNNGVKPLSDKDRKTIVKNVDDDVLKRQPIRFASSSVESDGGHVTASGTLTLVGTDGEASFVLDVSGDRVRGTTTVTQSAWGIKPYTAFLGALKVADEVEISVDAKLSAAR